MPTLDERVQARMASIPLPPGLHSPLEAAIIRTVAYGDVFDYPLTAVEVQRFLLGTEASPAEVIAALEGLTPDSVERHGGYYTLPGRGAIVPIRERRAAYAADLWPTAQRYARVIAGFPFVRMVAVTGALSVDNATEADDIDYLIVTEPGRLWLCRALIIGLVKIAARRGDDICPNFFLSERALYLDEQNVFSAHELVQMVPLAGDGVYARMLAENGWAHAYLPNANGQARRFEIMGTARLPKAALEAVLRTPLGGWLEGWEMRRKIEKLTRQAGAARTPEVSFNADRCQGHFQRHGERTLDAYQERLLQVDEELMNG